MSPRPVNSLLGTKPNLGPFPADQVFPWIGIFLLGIGLNSFFGVQWQWCGLFIVWGIATYWLLTGNRPWMFFGRFVRNPRWLRGHTAYLSPLELKAQPKRHAKAKISNH